MGRMMKLNKVSRLARAGMGASVVAALSVCGLVSLASATIYYATYKGTVTSDSDQLGIFGAAGSTNIYVGEAFTARYTLNIPSGIYVNNPGYRYYYGGGYYGSANPVVSAVATFGDKSYSLDFADIGEVSAQSIPKSKSIPGYRKLSDDIEEYGGCSVYCDDEFIQSDVAGISDNIPYTLTGPATYKLTAGDHGYQAINIYSAQDIYTGGNQFNTSVIANVSSVTLISSVPEPSTWAMLILGFSGLGVAMRSRRKPAFVAV